MYYMGFLLQVQKSGYRVPLMDPCGELERTSGWISYWGNDDRHWVWLKRGNQAEIEQVVARTPSKSMLCFSHIYIHIFK